ncbi:hypothetical protein [Candidatus Magnetominusculus xianensis]|uniref:Fructose 1,6-bisphosphatase n=1 Tax=Candidatus Magnetominusculus xianensis TaxID=1748249 RepID=A0ABR5SIZ8_9BACT|nr:hypothetical protein [Candidatus Magnetominusculus xianensis]KWT93110.1 putative fructose 1,6-bisphosphatase [Candidatus Magnetominusculus xianensis]
MWKIVKYGYDFFKLVFKFKEKGVTPMVDIDGSNNEVILIANNTGTINISKPVSLFINTTEGHFNRLASLVIPERIDTITAVDKNGDGIELTEDDKRLFSSTTKLLDDVFSIRCDIYRYDKYSRKGKRIVFDGQEIPEGYYSFKSLGRTDLLDILENMQKKEITVKVLQEVQTSASGMTSIAVLNIISTEE